MKRVLILFFLTVLGCTSDEPRHLVVGEWRWISSTGGIGGWTIKPRNDNERTLRLTADGKFEVYANRALLLSAEYRLSNRKSGSDRAQELILAVNNGILHQRDTLDNYPLFGGGRIRELSDAKLEFVEDFCNDCYSHSFVRK
ncbi:hypothetical protein [Larkinella arboricola]|uniref:hypothetical protein n=1 Tax=Larkinella arboricola TaxID=643671 RepID=UPI000DB9357D|nr:hypothetical protein [Larkinella arboricola]